MVEQSDVLLHKRDAQFICCLHYSTVVLATGRRGNVLGSAPRRSENIIDEREESIRANSYALELAEPLLALLSGKGLWHLALFEIRLEVFALDTGVGNKATAEQIDGIRLGRALGTLLPLQVERAAVESHPPVVGFVASEAGAVDSCWHD